jgi:hypothetical protein
MAGIQYHPLTLPGARLYQKEVQIRQFGPTEVENYYIIRRTGSIPALRTLIENTLKGIKIEELYEPDFLFMVYWQRVNSYSHFPYNLPWQCPTCNSNNSSKLDLTKIISPSVSDDYPPDGVSLDLPCGHQVIFRLPKEVDDITAAQQVRMLSIENPNESHFRKAELLCMMEFDYGHSQMEKWDLINKVFTPEDVFVIEGFKRLFRYGPNNLMDCKCTKCGEPREVSFRFSVLEFFPTDTDFADIRTRILSTKSLKHAVKRTAESVIPEALVVSETPPSGARQSSQVEAAARRPNGGSEAETVTPIITKEQSDRLTNRILEEVRHEVELDVAQGPARFDSIVKRK